MDDPMIRSLRAWYIRTPSTRKRTDPFWEDIGPNKLHDIGGDSPTEGPVRPGGFASSLTHNNKHRELPQMNFPNGFSVGGWCRSTSDAADQSILSEWNFLNANQAVYILWKDVGGAGIGYAFVVKASDLSNTMVGTEVASSTINTWQHVVGTYELNGRIKLYVDGV